MDEREVIRTARFTYQVTVELKAEKRLCQISECLAGKNCLIEKCVLNQCSAPKDGDGKYKQLECLNERCPFLVLRSSSCLGELHSTNVDVEILDESVWTKEDVRTHLFTPTIFSFSTTADYVRKHLPEVFKQSARFLWDERMYADDQEVRFDSRASREKGIRYLVQGFVSALRKRLGSAPGNKPQFVSKLDKQQIREKYLQRCAELDAEGRLSVENLANSFFDNAANPTQTMWRELQKIGLTNQEIIDKYQQNKNVE